MAVVARILTAPSIASTVNTDTIIAWKTQMMLNGAEFIKDCMIEDGINAEVDAIDVVAAFDSWPMIREGGERLLV